LLGDPAAKGGLRARGSERDQPGQHVSLG